MNLTTKKVELKLTEISAKASIVESIKKHENLLANASATFKFESGEYFTITSFSVWKSKYNGNLNVQMPQRGTFKFFLCEKSLWRKVEQIILDAYDFATMPIMTEKEEVEINVKDIL